MINPLAKELNDILKDTTPGALLSDLGNRLYFPKGIIAQSGEAKKLGKTANGTIGMTVIDGTPVTLPSIQENVPGLTSRELVAYAPTAGFPDLREMWKQDIIIGHNGQYGIVGDVTSAMEYTRTDNATTPSASVTGNAISGTTFNVGQSGYYWVRMKETETTSASAWGGPVLVRLYYTVIAEPDSVSTNRLYFTATGDSGIIERTPYKEWLVPEDGKINVTAHSSNETYYKITQIRRKNQETGVVTVKTISKQNSGPTGSFQVNAPYYVSATAGVYGSKTGDSSHLELWVELAALSLMGLGAALVLGRKKLKAQK